MGWSGEATSRGVQEIEVVDVSMLGKAIKLDLIG
jgi:hypothetical protein